MAIDPHPAWQGTFGANLGIAYEVMEPGRAVSTLQVRQEHLNPPGVCHGGVVFAMADDCMGAAIFGLVPEGHVPTVAQMNVHFMRSVRKGSVLTATATVASQGRRVAVIEARVHDEQQRQTALLTCTCMFVPARRTTP